MTDRFTTEAELSAQINDLAIQRRELTGQLVDAGSQVERNRITDEINALGTEQRDIEARVRQVRASRSASHATVLNGVNGAMSMPAPGPTFELYERTRSNSVHGEPGPAVSVTTTSMTLNARALSAIGARPGDTLSLYSLSAFFRWAGITPKKAAGLYELVHNDLHDHWEFQLPAGSWKPSSTNGPAVSDGGSATKGRGRTSAAKRGDLPPTSPHRPRATAR